MNIRFYFREDFYRVCFVENYNVINKFQRCQDFCSCFLTVYWPLRAFYLLYRESEFRAMAKISPSFFASCRYFICPKCRISNTPLVVTIFLFWLFRFLIIFFNSSIVFIFCLVIFILKSLGDLTFFYYLWLN